jgi:hypothetical protein
MGKPKLALIEVLRIHLRCPYCRTELDWDDEPGLEDVYEWSPKQLPPSRFAQCIDCGWEGEVPDLSKVFLPRRGSGRYEPEKSDDPQ